MTIIEPSAARRTTSLLAGMIPAAASDLHLIVGYRPTYRIHGRLTPAEGEVLTPADTQAMIASVVPPALQERFNGDLNLEFSVPLAVEDRDHRFRASVFRANGHYGACFRHIPTDVPSFEWMGFPAAVAEYIVSQSNGLVIITGVTGSGKSTTLAGLIHLMNQRGGYRIITVEEPIEYLHPATEQTLISQREVGADCASFFDGLKYGLRQDPNVIMVGEIRDPDTAQMALTAAETGHLILTTMHTKDAKGAVTRFLDLFAGRAQDEIRSLLALNLRCVIAQHLLPGPNPDDRRALAIEKMRVNLPVRSAIMQGKIESIESAIQTGIADGMIRMDDSLRSLLHAGRISSETARRYARNPDHLLNPRG